MLTELAILPRPSRYDRILVLCGGRVTGIVDGRTATKDEIGLLMTKGQKEESHV